MASIKTLRVALGLLTFSGILFALSCQKNIAKETESLQSGVTLADNAEVYTTLKYSIPQKSTDPNITTALANHMAFYNTNPVRKNLLYVFLPGTYRDPTQCQATTLKAASIGFHAIGLMYDNLVAGNPLCRATGDTTCHLRARREVIEGIPLHPAVNVWYANSLVNRLSKLLIYLNKTYPTQGWGQYLSNNLPVWSKIVIAGHSQGGAVAGVVGKYYPVKKVIMISMIDFLDNNKIPNWENMPARRNVYYAIINPSDELVPYAKVLLGWKALGMSAYGAPVSIGTTGLPYNHSHTLITVANPTTTMVDKYHNSTGVDAYIPKDASGKYVYDKAWEYLMTN